MRYAGLLVAAVVVGGVLLTGAIESVQSSPSEAQMSRIEAECQARADRQASQFSDSLNRCISDEARRITDDTSRIWWIGLGLVLAAAILVTASVVYRASVRASESVGQT